MRPTPLTVLRGGINRLRIRGGARADMLYDFTNAYITVAGSVLPREGTIREATLNSSTVGLAAMNGQFNVFANALQTVPPGYVCNVLVHPTNAALQPTKIWFAKPFMGFLYVTAQFSDGSIFDYWLQNNGTWAASTVYKTGNIILPPTPNGLAYLAVRDMPPNPTWSAESTIAAGAMVEPTEYTGFAYRAVAVAGGAPHTGSAEPLWPTTLGGIIQEFGDFDASATAAGSTQGSSTASTPQPLGSTITDRYGDSSTIAGLNTSSSGTASTTALASTKVTTWKKGTLYAPGAVVRPSTGQGAFINAIPNGDFEAGDDGNWIKSNADVTIQGTNNYQGSFSVKFALNHDDQSCTMNNFGTVTPGQSVTASAYLNPNNNGLDTTMWVKIRWYNSSDVFLSEVKSTGQNGFGYRKTSVTAIAPTGAAHCRIAIESATGTSPNPSYADLVVWSLETPAAVSNFLFEAVQSIAASSGQTEPTWPTVAGNTVIDNGVTWKAIGTSIITWQAVPIMYSGTVPPTFPTTVGTSVNDPSTYTTQDGHATVTNMSWQAINRQVSDTNDPNTATTALAASHVFKGNVDICSYSAAVDPTDWTSANNAGYLPTGLNNYGDNPIKVLTLYRSNLIVMNAGGYQMWQVDPDPANMALLDAQPVGSIYTRAAQSVANDLLFLTEVGVRNLGTVGATANMQIGQTGQAVDVLVKAALRAGTYDPLSLYYPGRGQYWLIFGPQAFVLTINGNGQKTWSRFIFPDSITDWTLNAGVLYLRSAGNLVWQLDDQTLQDDQGPVFTGSISGTLLTVTAVQSGTIVPGQTITTSPGWAQMVAIGGPYTPAPYGMCDMTTLGVGKAAAISSGGKSTYTTNGGNTWNTVNTPGFGLGGSSGVATDGTHIVGAFGFGAGILVQSADGGATWATVTPASFAAQDGVFYLPSFGLFSAFSSSAAKAAWSTTGANATWTVVAQTDQLVVNLPAAGCNPVADNGAGTAVRVGNIASGNGAIQSTTDGKTWTTRFNSGAVAFQSVSWDGDVFCATRGDQNYTSPDGITWTLKVTGPPPYSLTQAAINTAIITSDGNNSTSVGVSLNDGVTWATRTCPIGVHFLGAVSGTGVITRALALGAGIASTFDGSTWTTEASLPTYVMQFAMGNWALGVDPNGNGVVYKYIASQSVHIAANGTGSGGTGTYTVDTSLNFNSGTITADGADVNFTAVMQWPYLDVGVFGYDKMLVGIDLTGTGSVTIQIAYREDDPTTFVDNPGFATSLNVTAPYTVSMADTTPGTPIPIPVESPSYSVILTWGANQAWSWQAANLYMQDARGGDPTS